jgi:hypothetical protein
MPILTSEVSDLLVPSVICRWKLHAQSIRHVPRSLGSRLHGNIPPHLSQEYWLFAWSNTEHWRFSRIKLHFSDANFKVAWILSLERAALPELRPVSLTAVLRSPGGAASRYIIMSQLIPFASVFICDPNFNYIWDNWSAPKTEEWNSFPSVLLHHGQYMICVSTS